MGPRSYQPTPGVSKAISGDFGTGNGFIRKPKDRGGICALQGPSTSVDDLPKKAPTRATLTAMAANRISMIHAPRLELHQIDDCVSVDPRLARRSFGSLVGRSRSATRRTRGWRRGMESHPSKLVWSPLGFDMPTNTTYRGGDRVIFGGTAGTVQVGANLTGASAAANMHFTTGGYHFTLPPGDDLRVNGGITSAGAPQPLFTLEGGTQTMTVAGTSASSSQAFVVNSGVFQLDYGVVASSSGRLAPVRLST
jgi:hypothetical protein